MPLDHTAHDSRKSIQHSTEPGIVSTIVYFPIQILLWLCTKLFRPFVPQLVPLAVFIILVPVVVTVSILAGWVVWRSAPAAWEAPLFLQYGDGVPPYAETDILAITAQQSYDILLRLSVPVIQANLGLGNFMASLRLSSPSNKTIASIRRSATLIEPSKFPFFPVPRLVNLDIPLLESFVIGSSRAVATVEIGRRDNWKSLGSGEGRELTIGSAALLGVVKHRGLSGLVSRFPLPSAIIAAIVFLFIALLALGACVLPLMLPKQREDLDGHPDILSLNKDAPYLPSDDDEKPSRSRRRSRPSKSASRRMIKTELDSVPILPAEERTQTIRRRRSRDVENKAESDL